MEDTWNVVMKYLVSSLCSTTRNSIGGKIFDRNTFSSIHYKPDNLTEMVSAEKIPAWDDGTPSHSLSSFLPLSAYHSLHPYHNSTNIMHPHIVKTIVIIVHDHCGFKGIRSHTSVGSRML